MKKHLFLKTLLVLIGVLIGSVSTQMWAGASWIGNSYIVVGNTWYNGSGSGQSAGAFNNKDLGKISSLSLGGEVQTYGQSDGAGHPARMHYKFDDGDATYITLPWKEYKNNNNYFQSTGNSISLSGLAAGSHKLRVWFEQPDGNQWDSNGGNNYVADFTLNPLVTFKANGGTGSDYTQRVTYNINTALNANTFTRTGYTFAGWATSADGSVVYSDKANVKLTAHTTLYAKWTAKTYNITLDDNGSYQGDGSATVKYGDAALTVSSHASRTDWNLVGYWTASGSDGSQVTDASGNLIASISGYTDSNKKWIKDANCSLYAHWNQINSLTVTAGTHVGTVTGSTSPVTLGNSYAISASNFDPGYQFNNWTASPAGNASFASSTSASTTVTVSNGSVTVTANASEIMRTITITGGSAASTTAGVATQGTATANAPAEGKKFTGWTLGTGVSLAGGYALTDRTIKFTATQNSSVTANYADRAQVKMYFAKPTSLSWETLYAYAWNSSNASQKNADYPGVELSTTEVINCVTYYIYQYYTEADGIGGDATGNSAWNSIVFGCNSDDKKTGDLTISNGHYYYWNSATTGSASAVTDIWYIKGTMNDWGTTNPITLDCANNKGTVNITLTKGTTYEFKVYDVVNTKMWSNSTAHGSTPISGTMATPTTLYNDDANVMKITADVTGPYTFEVSSTNTTTPAVKVTFPTTYTVTFNAETFVNDDASHTTSTDGGTLSAVDGNSAALASGGKVISGGTAVITASKQDGYSFIGFYTNAACTTAVSGAGVSISDNVLTLSSIGENKTVYAKFSENMTTVNLVASPTGKGTFTCGGDAVTSVSAGVTTHPAVTAVAGSGYSVNTSATVWSESSDYISLSSTTTNPTTITATGTSGNSATLTATFTPNPYTITLKKHNGDDDGSVSVTYDNNANLTSGVSTPEKTGYTFGGYYTGEDGTGTPLIDGNGDWITGNDYINGSGNWVNDGNVTLHAKWTPKTTTISFSQSGTGYRTGGETGTKTATYDAAMPTTISTPTAANGYAFMGYYDALEPLGTQYYDEEGASAHIWDKEDAAVTLYAYFKMAAITGLTLSKTTVSPGEEDITVTPTIDPDPTETTIVCYEIQYSDGTALSPQPASTYNTGTKVLTFTAPSASATYKIHATLETGSTCGSGTELSTRTTTFQVAGSHTVTVEYKQSSTTIKTSTSVTANPTDWSDEIAAPDIFGYTFSGWTAGDGVTITDDDGETSGTSSFSATIKIKATYNGTLTANYTPKSLIYFKNTLNWSSVYVNFYGEDGYWDASGSGNKTVTNRNKAMTRIGETDVWYFDYGYNEGGSSIMPTKWVAFTQDLQNGDGSGAQNFWALGTGEPVSYPACRADDLVDKAGETGFYSATPMFVPLAGQTPVTLNEGGGGKALYYNSGYWTKYLPGTGYTLEIYNEAGNSKLKEMDFSSADELMPMKAVADLEAGTTYKFQIKRQGDVYLGNSGTMTYSDHGQSTPWEMTNTGFSMCRITTTAAGNYTFNFTYSAYHNESTGKDEYRMRLSVDYPVADGDYRLIYTDETRSFMDDEVKKYRFKPSAIVSKENNGTAIVSFFVRQNQTPVLRIQQASVDGSGNITWNEYPTSGTPTNQITDDIASAIDETGVYNFNLSMNGSGALSVTSATDYTGNFYIRTDAANSKWDNYRTDLDHLMTYSDYAATKSASASNTGYTHYYTHWVNKDDVGRKNVKFVIANDYSPCISDTLAREAADGTWANIATFMEEGGDLKRSANVRFMWNIVTNEVSRAYVDGAQEDGSQFLLLLSGDSKIKQGETTKTSVTFSDNGNWIYETNIKAQPGAQIKLKSTWGEGTTIVQFFKGSEDDYEQLVGGNTENWYDFRLIYDFKTNRLVSSYVPVDAEINTDIAINADVMFIREHQGDIAQLTFGTSGKISMIETAYGVMRFNRWTLNNKDDKEPYSSLPIEDQISNFERGLYWISFPFKVNLNEAFGFGTYGTHWIMMRYNGARRATEGYWADSEGFWEYITNRSTILQPNEGYVLALDLDLLGVSSSIFANTDVIELYFPSYGDMPDISSSDVTTSLEAHQCTIDRTNGGAYNVNKNRTIADSHWNVMGVPTYVNTDDIVYENDTWTSAVTGVGPNFLYVWKAEDNSYVPTSASDYTYKAMHAYMVQYYGAVSWAAKSGSPYPSSIAARKAETQDVEYRLELQSDTRMEDQTFVRFTDDAAATTGFEFGQDLSKEYNGNRSNIYTFTAGTPVAGNSQPHPLTTTIVPVGVKIVANGEYTFSMPEGTNGGDVWLIDNANSSRTNLGLMDYTVNLTTGTYEGRFSLEFPVQNVVTEIENAANANANANADVRKVFVGGRLYILRDGKAYDATGAQVR